MGGDYEGAYPGRHIGRPLQNLHQPPGQRAGGAPPLGKRWKPLQRAVEDAGPCAMAGVSAIPQPPCGRQLPLRKGAFGAGVTDFRPQRLLHFLQGGMPAGAEASVRLPL